MTDKFLKDKNYAPEKLGDVCVLGLGKTGNVAAFYLCELLGNRVNALHVYAGEKKQFAMHAADNLLKRGVSVSFDDKQIDNQYDLCIASPGIAETSELIKSAKKNCKEVISEVEFAWRESSKNAKWIGITGTNGKTTTTSLITHILKSAGKHAVNVGNIGNVALDAVTCDQKKSFYERNEIYVAELSSYQLALCDKLSLHASILLNITPDHISWHGSFENYSLAKLNIFNNANIAIVNADDEQTATYIDDIKSKGVKELILNKYDKDYIIVERGDQSIKIIAINDMKIIGEHNCVNARAAASACLTLGLSADQIADGIKSFKPLEHRLEPCGIVAGVRLYNDSKATNVDSVLVAMDSFEDKKAIFLMGGHDKNTDLTELVSKALKKLNGVICYGEAQDRFYDAFKQQVNDDKFFLAKSKNMKTAFKLAMENVYPGDYVVLSPACSSFDEFDSFEQRGEVFKALVEKCKQ